jgi:hypothetical protein
VLVRQPPLQTRTAVLLLQQQQKHLRQHVLMSSGLVLQYNQATIRNQHKAWMPPQSTKKQ